MFEYADFEQEGGSWFYDDPAIQTTLQDTQVQDLFTSVQDIVTSITGAGVTNDVDWRAGDDGQAGILAGGTRLADEGSSAPSGSISKMLTGFMKVLRGETAEDRKVAAPIIGGTLGAVLMGIGGGISASQARKAKKEELEQLKPLQMAQTDYLNAQAEEKRKRTANQDFSKVNFSGIINQPYRPAPIAPLYQPRRA